MPRRYLYTERESSKVREIGYDIETKVLTVVFADAKYRYHYPDIAPSTVTEIMFGKSIGSNVMRFLVTTKHPFTKEPLEESAP